MKEAFTRLELERLADETAAQAFGVGSNDLDSFITQQCGNREGVEITKVLDVLLGRLSQYRNRLLHVELLPDDILLHIFKLALNFDWLSDITRNTTPHHDLRVHYRNLDPIQRVNQRWHHIIASYEPFWSLISTTMPKNVIELALTRAKESTLCIWARYDEEDSARHFMDMVLPSFSRIGSLMVELGTGGDEILAPLWACLPSVQNLRIAGAKDISYQGSDGSPPTPGTPSLRWIRLIDSVAPTIPTLYAQLEELSIEDPPETLTLDVLKLIVSSAPRLRILRLEQLPGESPDTESPVEPIPMPNLQLLHIFGSSNYAVGTILDCFQLSPSTSIQIYSRDRDITPLESHIRSQIWAALHSMTETSFCLELTPPRYKLQTRKTLIEIEVGDYSRYPRWPDFFKDFVPGAGQAPIRVYIFLKATSAISAIPWELPNEDCIAGLQSDSFFMM